MEAVIRVAQSKALPTEEEVERSGYVDGGDFLIGLRRDNPSVFRAFVRENDRQWWESTRQPVSKKLEILLQLIMRTLATNLARWEADGSMGKARKEAAKVAARRQQAATRPTRNQGGVVYCRSGRR